MWKKILSAGLIIWFAILLTDIVTSFTIHHPIFTIAGQGGCFQPYYGFGYSITFRDGMTPTGYYYDTHPVINMWIYLLINIPLVLLLIFNRRIFRKR
ncbi:MAG: hypothetical protein P4M02_08525 [Clostridia bacterium]|nr:hypothetical protein [Clostridia bacterium]